MIKKQLIFIVSFHKFLRFFKTMHQLMKHGVSHLMKIKNELKGSLEMASYCDYFLRLIENDGEKRI